MREGWVSQALLIPPTGWCGYSSWGTATFHFIPREGTFRGLNVSGRLENFKPILHGELMSSPANVLGCRTANLRRAN
jgi:hypothetical protein